jgi:anti-anti-sigma factor
MALSVVLAARAEVAEITLVGELDAATAPLFQAELEKAAALKPRHLVLLVKELEFMASAGIRMLIFAKQKMGRGVGVYVIAPQEPILDTLRRTGLLHSVIVQTEFAPGSGLPWRPCPSQPCSIR